MRARSRLGVQALEASAKKSTKTEGTVNFNIIRYNLEKNLNDNHLTDYESFQKSAFNSKKWHCDFGRNKV
jgi:hypothetical protein